MQILKPEWFKIDPAKFLSDAQVDAMTTLELGACMRLLCRQWLDVSLPDDLHLLARLCRLDTAAMEQAWITLGPFFPPIEGGRRANRFMFQQRETVIAELERRSDEGARAARKRWNDVRKVASQKDGLPMPHPMPDPLGDPMQEKRRTEQSRVDKQPNATPNGLPIPSESRGSDTCDQPAGLNSTEVSRALCSENGWSGKEMIWTLKDAIEFQAKQMPEASLEQVGEWLVKAYNAHRTAQGKYAVGVQKFFAEGRYKALPQSGDGDYFKDRIFSDNPATRALAQMEAD